jgi:hypothetical protein
MNPDILQKAVAFATIAIVIGIGFLFLTAFLLTVILIVFSPLICFHDPRQPFYRQSGTFYLIFAVHAFLAVFLILWFFKK